MTDFIDVTFTCDNSTDLAVVVRVGVEIRKPLFSNDALNDLASSKRIIQDPMINAALKDMTFAKKYTPWSVKKDVMFQLLERMPFWEGGGVFTTLKVPSVDRAGRIFGTVKVQGALQNKARVSLYFRKTGALIQSTFTNESGEFLFECGLNRDTSDYYAVAITEQPFNAQIFDKLTPI
jgi:hypothetical protein